MALAITRQELSAPELRKAARSRDANAARRMLAIALVLEGCFREEAAGELRHGPATLRDGCIATSNQGVRRTTLKGLPDWWTAALRARRHRSRATGRPWWPVGSRLEIWFMGEARVGQRGARPRAVRDHRCTWAWLSGAVCPERAVDAAAVLPEVTVEAMNFHLAPQIPRGRHDPGTNSMPVSAARSGSRGRPPSGWGRSRGSSGSIAAQRSSGTGGFAMPRRTLNIQLRQAF